MYPVVKHVANEMNVKSNKTSSDQQPASDEEPSNVGFLIDWLGIRGPRVCQSTVMCYPR